MTPSTPVLVDNAGAPKKPYAAPRLELYGNIHQITQTVGTTGLSDGGGMGMNRTQP